MRWLKRLLILLFLFIVFTYSTAESNRTKDSIEAHYEFIIEHFLKTQINQIRSDSLLTTEYAKSFLSKEYILSVIKNSNVPVSIVLGQSILETSWGRSVKGNNYFGIKALSNDSSVSVKTVEYIDNERRILYDDFAAYNSAETSIKAHSNLLNRIYGITYDMEYKDALYKLKRYATDPYYRIKLKQLIERYELYEFDELNIFYRRLLIILKS